MKRPYLLCAIVTVSVVAACELFTGSGDERLLSPAPPAPESPGDCGEERMTPPDPVPDQSDHENKTQEERAMILKPLPIFPAYYFDHNGVLWGIPATLQGTMDKEKIQPTEIDGDTERPVTLDGFYIRNGEISMLVKISDAFAWFSQPRNETPDIPLAGVTETDFSIPPPVRQIINAPTFGIYTTVYQGVEYSDVYNNSEAMKRYTTNQRGYGPVRRPMVDAYIMLENGLLYTTGREEGAGLEFWPSNRTAVNHVAEAGRLWK